MKKISALFCVIACFTMIFSVSAFANKANTMGTHDMTQDMRINELNTANPGHINKNNTNANTVPNAINRAAHDIGQAGRDITRPLTNNGYTTNGVKDGYHTDGVKDGYRTNAVNDGNRAYNTNNGYRHNNLRANTYNAKATTGGSNWGWLGLLGLIGLAGMRSKDRERT